MALEYKVGKLNIDVKRFKHSKTDTLSHGYIVESKGEELYIHVSSNFTGVSSHKNIATDFSILEEDIVGGGSIYVDSKGYLILDDLCTSYDSVPKGVAENLAKALLFDLSVKGIDVEGIKANPPQFCINKRWSK